MSIADLPPHLSPVSANVNINISKQTLTRTVIVIFVYGVLFTA